MNREDKKQQTQKAIYLICEEIYSLTKDGLDGRLTTNMNESQERAVIRSLQGRGLLIQTSKSRKKPHWEWVKTKTPFNDQLAESIYREYSEGSKILNDKYATRTPANTSKASLKKYPGITAADCKVILQNFGWQVKATRTKVVTTTVIEEL